MTSTADELAALAAVLREVLGTGDPAAVPVVDDGWRTGWPQLAELGLTGFCVPAALGGSGTEVGAALVAARELGAALHGVAVPGAHGGDLGAGPRARGRRGARPRRRRPRAGDRRRARGRRAPSPGGSVHGRAGTVLGAGACDSYVVVDPDGRALAHVRRRRGRHRAGGVGGGFDVSRPWGAVSFTGAPGRPLDAGAADVERTVRLLGLLLAGDAIGGLQRMLDRTVRYAKERVAFGTADRRVPGRPAPPGRPHGARAGPGAPGRRRRRPALTADPDGRDAAPDRRALLAEAAVARDAVVVLHDLLQLTGAIGFTWEHGLHFFERRAHLDARLGGGARRAVAALAAREGWT